MKLLPVWCLFPFISSLPLAAQLQWETQQVETKAAPEQTHEEAVYRFQNVGTNTVTITKMTSSCGCTTPKLAKYTYAPGEKGEVVADFQFAQRVGLQHKTITVQTDDPAHPTTTLTLIVNIPEFVRVSPTFLFWQPTEHEIKEIRLERVNDVDFKIQSVSSENPKFQVVLLQGENGNQSIQVTPPEHFLGFTRILIQAVLSTGQQKTLYAYARVGT